MVGEDHVLHPLPPIPDGFWSRRRLPTADGEEYGREGGTELAMLDHRIAIGKCDNWNVNHRKSGNEYNSKDGI